MEGFINYIVLYGLVLFLFIFYALLALSSAKKSGVAKENMIKNTKIWVAIKKRAAKEYIFFGICLLVYVRSLAAFYTLSYIRDAPARAGYFLLAVAGLGGVLAGAALSCLLMGAPVPLIVPLPLSLAIALPLLFFLAKRTLGRLKILA